MDICDNGIQKKEVQSDWCLVQRTNAVSSSSIGRLPVTATEECEMNVSEGAWYGPPARLGPDPSSTTLTLSIRQQDTHHVHPPPVEGPSIPLCWKASQYVLGPLLVSSKFAGGHGPTLARLTSLHTKLLPVTITTNRNPYLLATPS